MAQVGRKSTFEAGNVRFAVQHELWDGNLDDHCDQGVAIDKNAKVDNTESEEDKPDVIVTRAQEVQVRF